MLYMPLKFLPSQTVVLETDIGGDVDDVGALTMLVDGARKYGYKMGGISLNRNTPNIVEGVRALLCMRGFADVPIASPVAAPESTHIYMNEMAKYLTEEADLTTIPAVEFYKRLFDGAEDGGVTIVSIGFLQNVQAAWRSMPELFEKKVRSVVVMGGSFLYEPNYKEYNFTWEGHLDVTTDFVGNYPGQVIYCGFECGQVVWTDVSPKKEVKDPVIDAYRAFGSRPGLFPYRRESFDPMTVDFAIHGEGAAYRLSPTVKVWLEDGMTRYRETPDGNAAFIIMNDTEEALGERISRAILDSIGEEH